MVVVVTIFAVFAVLKTARRRGSSSGTDAATAAADSNSKPLPSPAAAAPATPSCKTPPEAWRMPVGRLLHGERVVDDFGWMNTSSRVGGGDQRSAYLLDHYIQAENNYTDWYMQGSRALELELQLELQQWEQQCHAYSRESDASSQRRFPSQDFWLMERYFYYVDSGNNNNSNQRHAIYKRWPRSADNKNGSTAMEIARYHAWHGQVPGLTTILDLNHVLGVMTGKEENGGSGGGGEFVAVGALEVSGDEQLLAYSLDRTGAERFTLTFRNLTTGQDLPNYRPSSSIPDTYYSVRWFHQHLRGGRMPGRMHRDRRDGQWWVYYNALDARTNMPSRVYRYCVVGCVGDDGGGGGALGDEKRPPPPELVYQVTDRSSTAHVGSSVDGRFLFVLVSFVGVVTPGMIGVMSPLTVPIVVVVIVVVVVAVGQPSQHPRVYTRRVRG